MMEGKVKWYNAAKHYGFIEGNDGKSYFLHASQLPSGIAPVPGQAVKFKPVEKSKGVQAESVKLL